jgi:hypothetical protein
VPFAIFMPYDFENFLYGPFSCLIVSFNPKVYFYHVDVLEHYREERKSLKIIEARESLIVHIHEQKIIFFFMSMSSIQRKLHCGVSCPSFY